MSVESGRASDYTNIKAASYAKGRARYPEEVIKFIFEFCQLKPEDTLIDVGSGTGISTRPFSERGLTVFGIEPNENMRQQAQLANDQLSGNKPIYKEGSGEKIDLPDHSADIVLAAQSFHWCNAKNALSEFRRVLKPNGWIVLLWHHLDESDRFTRTYADLMRKYCEGLVQNQIMHLTAGIPLLLETSLAYRNKMVLKEKLRVTEEDLCNRALSDLFAPKRNQEEWLQQIRRVFQEFQVDESAVLCSLFELFIARVP